MQQSNGLTIQKKQIAMKNYIPTIPQDGKIKWFNNIRQQIASKTISQQCYRMQQSSGLTI